MLRFLALFALPLATATAAQTSVKRYVDAGRTELADHPLTAAEVAEDVAVFRRAVEEVVPFPYLNAPEARVDSLADAILAEGAMRPLAFYERMSRLKAVYDGSHYFLGYPAYVMRDSFMASGTGIFPLRLDRIGGALVVAGHSQDLPKASRFRETVGDTLLRVNGLDADSLFTAFYRYVGGTETTKAYDTRESYHQWLWLNGVRGPFAVELRDSTGATYAFTDAGWFLAAPMPSAEAASAKTAPKPPTFRDVVRYELVNDSTAYLRVARIKWFSESEMTQLMDSAFADMRARGIGTLLIDLRGNGGGQDWLAYPLLDYLSPVPYWYYGADMRKVSPAYGRFFRKHSSYGWLLRRIPYNPAIKLVYHRHPTEPGVYSGVKPGKMPKGREPKPAGERFQGQAYLIVDGGTYSSGVSVADAFQHFGMGTVVGQPTGSAPTELGETMSLRLPNSGLLVYLPTVYYVRASGELSDTRPVQPEITVPVQVLDRADAADLAAIIRAGTTSAAASPTQY